MNRLRSRALSRVQVDQDMVETPQEGLNLLI